ncbi:zinc finger protein 131-like isoform X1 [Colias croceus]|uniref:zinc finger protein 131-like isoform X1 n=3 Tax=Colias crocea TaxID=72248 RepID=UPI001E27E281|nr:zinc finger protein 131-like isoform X1 [Colias croceus]
MAKNLRYSLSWSEHLSNISSGLSDLQQNEEFVDMTLAADGHFVKVHKVIMALASPYLKEIISSTKCEHPVIFLNKISYTTLSSILEYVYTGEVYVHFENINEFIVAAKDLHIRGLQDVNIVNSIPTSNEPCTLDSTYQGVEADCIITLDNSQTEVIDDDLEINDSYSVNDSVKAENRTDVENKDTSQCIPTLHYTVSNRGSLQMILNNFMYYLKHTNKDNSRQWRCVDYLNNRKCPALIFTKGDVVVQRIAAHNHAVHNDKIFKKFRSGTVFAAIKDAMDKGLNVSKASKEDPLNSE